MKTLSEKAVYSGKIFSVVQQEVQIGNQTKIFEVAKRAPWTRLIIINNEGNLLLSREYRKETNNYDTRLPWWKVFDTLVEYEEFLQSWGDIQEAAKQWAIKEAHEEVGVISDDIDFFAKSINGATIEWDLYYYVVRNYKQSEQNLDPWEDISFDFYNLDDVKRMCLDWTIQEDRSAMMLMKFLHKK